MTIILVMTMLALAEAKAKLSAVLDDVRDTHDRVVITRNGHPEAVVMSLDDLEAIEETLSVLSTPGLVEKLDGAANEIDTGDFRTADELRKKYLGRDR